MNFVSAEFAVLLAAVLAVYYFLPQRARMLCLLGASYVFYCYWRPAYGLIILASTLLDYAMAIAIDKAKSQRRRRAALFASVAGNLGMLAYFKYTGFALETLRALLGPLGQQLPGPLALVLPVGISFYTFQTMSYTIDVYRGTKRAERDFVLVALYVGFFPQLVAGPIERAAKLMPQLRRRMAFSAANIEEGGRLILLGLFKKAVIADHVAPVAYRAFLNPADYGSARLAFSAVAMMISLYLDFSAYSQIAIGTARLFGVRLSTNFRFPYIAGNMGEFWRRWHITMSTWVHDYLFVPLGGFHPRRLRRHARNTLVTMGLVGLWHGAQWTFVLWGLCHGAALLVYQLIHIHVLRPLRQSPVLSGLPWRVGSWAITTAVRVLLSILFFAPDLGTALVFFDRLCLHPSPTVGGLAQAHVLLGLAFPPAFWAVHYVLSRVPFKERLNACHPAVRALFYATVVYVILFGSVDKADPFIYFQF